MHPTPPVLFLTFNRPRHAEQVFSAIREARPSKLFLATDGPRPNRDGEEKLCLQCQLFEKRVDWPCDVKTLFRETNLGCKVAVSSAIDWFFDNVEEGIILEDDCVPCPDFFKFCSAMLLFHRNNSQVMHVGGINLQAGTRRGTGSYYASHFVHIWGWATWKRAWRKYDVKMISWPESKRTNWIATRKLPWHESKHWTDIFDKVHAGEVDTWDYQWLYACWQNDGIALIPNVNLVTNVGAGPEATHTKGPVGSLALATAKLGEITHPQKLLVDHTADEFTFNVHCGGNEILSQQRDQLRQQTILGRVHRKLSILKHKFHTIGKP